MDQIKVEFIPANRWWKRSKWRLLEDYISCNGRVKVVAGFISDGGSIPPMFYWLFSPTGIAFSAYLIHDFVLVTENDWRQATQEFKAELKLLDISPWRILLLVNTTRIYGKVKRLFQ